VTYLKLTPIRGLSLLSLKQLLPPDRHSRNIYRVQTGKHKSPSTDPYWRLMLQCACARSDTCTNEHTNTHIHTPQ